MGDVCAWSHTTSPGLKLLGRAQYRASLRLGAVSHGGAAAGDFLLGTSRMNKIESLDYDEAEHTFIESRHELSEKEQKMLNLRLTALTVALMLFLGMLVGSSAHPPARSSNSEA